MFGVGVCYNTAGNLLIVVVLIIMYVVMLFARDLEFLNRSCDVSGGAT